MNCSLNFEGDDHVLGWAEDMWKIEVRCMAHFAFWILLSLNGRHYLKENGESEQKEEKLVRKLTRKTSMIDVTMARKMISWIFNIALQGVPLPLFWGICTFIKLIFWRIQFFKATLLTYFRLFLINLSGVDRVAVAKEHNIYRTCKVVIGSKAWV